MIGTPESEPAIDRLPVGAPVPDVALQCAPDQAVALAAFRGFDPPLLSDFEPRGAAARAYRVYAQWLGASGQALFLVHGDGILRWSYLAPIDVHPGVDGVRSALETLGAGGRMV